MKAKGMKRNLPGARKRPGKAGMLIFWAIIAVLFVGCVKRGEYVAPARAQDNFEVARLFETDGVTVYRFRDGGYYHYFAVRNSAVLLESVYLKGNGKMFYPYYGGTLPEAVE